MEAAKARSPTTEEWGVVNEIVPRVRLLARAHEIADGIAALPPLTGRYTRIALAQRLRRLVEEGTGYGLAFEGISAADVARRMIAQARALRPDRQRDAPSRPISQDHVR